MNLGGASIVQEGAFGEKGELTSTPKGRGAPPLKEKATFSKGIFTVRVLPSPIGWLISTCYLVNPWNWRERILILGFI